MEVIAERAQEGLKAKAHALFDIWRDEFKSQILDQGYKPLEVEGEFVFPLTNPDNGLECKTFNEAGKRDGVMEDESGNIWLLEHKTSSEDISPGSNYWKRLHLDTQISKYLISLHHEFPERQIMGVIYDVVKKPLQRFGSVPVLDDDNKKIVRDENGNRVWNKNGTPKQSADSKKGHYVETRDETIEEYENRLRNILEGDPGKWVQIQFVAQTDETLANYLEDSWNYAEQIKYFRRKNMWAKNPDQCLLYGQCEFLELCSGISSIDGIRFRKRTSLHPELSSAPDVSKKELLTNSRLKALRKCGKYHYLKYEDPTELVGETSEALWFGSYWHDHLEEYLKAYAGI